MAELDYPISSPEQDAFARTNFAKRLSNALVDREKRRATGYVIGLKGEWGSGKSSILNLVRSELASVENSWRPDKFGSIIIIDYNPWIVRGTEGLIAEFFSEFISAIEKHPLMRSGQIGRKIISIAHGFGPLISIAASAALGQGGATGRSTWDTIARMFDKSLSDRREELQDLIRRARRELGAAFVVIIDELDRVEDHEVRAVAQLIKAIADFPEISYLLAYDRDRVVEALGYTTQNGENNIRGSSYLGKIIQIELSMPPPLNSELIVFFDNSLRMLLDEYSLSLSPAPAFPEDYEILRNLLITKRVVRTPRDVRRLLGHFSILNDMLSDKTHWWDILALSALETLCPSTYKLLESDPGLFVSDAVGSSQFEEQYISVKESEILQSKGIDKSSLDWTILNFLFPQVREDELEYDRPSDRSPHALSNYESLVLALRRGSVPGGVDRVWFTNWLLLNLTDKITRLLELAHSDGRRGMVRFASILEWEELESSSEKRSWEAWLQALLSLRKRGINYLELERVVAWPESPYHTTFLRRLISGRLSASTAQEFLDAAIQTEYSSMAVAIARRIDKEAIKRIERKQDIRPFEGFNLENIFECAFEHLLEWKNNQERDLSELYEIVMLYANEKSRQDESLNLAISEQFDNIDKLLNFVGQTFGESVSSQEGRRASFFKETVEAIEIIVPMLKEKIRISNIATIDYPKYLSEAIGELIEWAESDMYSDAGSSR